MNLSRFARRHFAHLPTPLERLPRLSAHLGGPQIWIKRDDCTGLSTGGNKTRKLEFLMGDAREQGADTVITQGATQSNHARQTAAATARLGLDCHLLLEDRTGSEDPEYNHSGNVLLDQLHGATVSRLPGGTDMDGEMSALAERLSGEGRKPYVIPGGGSNEIGALGYVNAALELLTQANDMDLRIDHVIHATGSSGTQAGLVAGLTGARTGVPVLGIGVSAPREEQERDVFALAERTADRLGITGAVTRADIVVNSDYVGTRLRHSHGRHVRGRRPRGAPGGAASRSRVLGQGHGGVDRPDPQGAFRARRQRGVPAHRRQRRPLRVPLGVRRRGGGYMNPVGGASTRPADAGPSLSAPCGCARAGR